MMKLTLKQINNFLKQTLKMNILNNKYKIYRFYKILIKKLKLKFNNEKTICYKNRLFEYIFCKKY